MAISDRLTKLTTDITNAYTSIENKGGTIPSDKNTNNLATAIDSIEVIEEATAEGEDLTLTNTKAMPFKNVKVKGKTEQFTTTGKNFYNKYGDFNYPTSGYVNRTTLLSDGTIKTTANNAAAASRGIQLVGLKANTTYTVTGKLLSSTGSGTTNIAAVSVRGYDANWTRIGQIGLQAIGSFSFNFNTGTYTDFFVSLNANGSLGSSYEAIYDEIMVSEEGGDYEPYTRKSSKS